MNCLILYKTYTISRGNGNELYCFSTTLSGNLGGGWSWGLWANALVPILIADARQPFNLLEQYHDIRPSAFCFW